MERKVLIGVMFLALFAIPNVSAQSVLEHKFDDIGIFRACSYYELVNFNDLNELKTDTLRLDSKKEVIGNMNSGEWEWKYSEPFTIQVLDKINESNVCKFNVTTQKDECHEEKEYIYKNETGYKITWLPYDDYKTRYLAETDLKIKPIQEVRYCADIERKQTDNGFEISIDIIPEYDKTIYSKLNWWNSSWSRKKAVNISISAGSTAAGYPVLFNVTNEIEMNNDFSDIRFVNGSEDTELDHWLRNYTASEFALFEIEIDQPITTTNYTFYMYYGNPSAQTASDGDATFIFFDDAETGSLTDEWTVTGTAGYTDEQAFHGNRSINYTANVAINNSSPQLTAFEVESHFMDDTSVTSNEALMWLRNGIAYDGVLGFRAGESTINYSFYDSGYFTSQVARSNGWRKFGAKTEDYTSYVELYIDDVLIHNDTTTATSHLDSTYFSFEANGFYVDTIIVRPYVPGTFLTGFGTGELIGIIVFLSQVPADITSTNIMNVTANITYNIISEDLNTSTIRLETTINSSSGISFINVNGISNPMNRSFNFSFNVSGNFTTILDDNDIYPASYAIEDDTMVNSDHIAYVAGNDNQLIKTTLLNVSNSSTFSLFEIMTNSSSGICDIFYCNSSYTTGTVTTSTNCGGFASILPNTPFNHVHSGTGKSSHIFVPLGLNTTSGTISDVQVTPLSYFIIRGNGCNTFYISNNTGTAQTSINNGNSWTNQPWTVDSHLHQYDDDVFYYRQCANTTGGFKFCSDLRFDNLDVTPLPPSAPFIITPQEGTVRGIINILYEECISPIGNAIDYYNISLLYPNLTFFDNISDNNSLNLNFLWNSSLVTDDDYRIEVNCVDNQTLNTSAFSGIITVFNNITIEIPDSAIFCFSDSVLYIREVETVTTISGLVIEENSTVIERFIRCNNGCSNSTLTNWGNPGCEEDPMVLWVALLVAVILLALLFKGINR